MLRMTRQRSAVSDLLGRTEDFRSAQQLHEMLRSSGSTVGLATVYRTLQSLAEAGQVDVLRTGDGEALYRRCARQTHHHHLVCRECGRTVEIEGETVERWAAKVAQDNGFVDVDHTAELFGTCSVCATERYAEGTRA
ncbi:Fur family zinc uptake regulator [Georgenia soli]|uniref:Fur family zinc uptake regulator n=1 Tax=Georgenia soli TaxID=638953 RepID=A0A2A9ESS8_9MICO|nr:Fur family transcriptional regulator [Georgenia soli]PFG41295.1 Fur family zinc uptake regulator [Georgenia soli]